MSHPSVIAPPQADIPFSMQNGQASPSPVKPVNKRRPAKKVLLALAALLITVAFIQLRRASTANITMPQIKTAVVGRGDVKATVSATGTLQAFTTVDVKSKAGGTVLKMAVEEGTRVKKGQLIAIIDRQDTSAAYAQAMADVAAARGAVEQAKANAQLQSNSLGPQIRQSAEAVSSARAKLEQSQQTLTLEKTTVGPAIRQSSEAVASARAKLASAQQSLELQRQTSVTVVQEAQSGVVAAQAKLDQAETTARTQPELSQAAIAQAQAGVDAAQANVRSTQESLRLLQSATQPQETASVQAQVNQAKSDMETAEANLKRQQALFAKGYVAQNTIDTVQNQVVAARAALSTAQARLDTIKEQQAAQVQEQRARVQQAQGSLSQTQAALATAKSNTIQDALKEKDATSARAALQQAQATLQNAIANRQQIALKATDVTAAQAAVRQAEAALTSTKANSRQVAVKASDVAAAQAAVRQAEAALQGTQVNTIQNNVRAQEVAQAMAKLNRAEVTAKNARTNLEQTQVLAPRDGIVLKKYVDEGAIIQSGQSGFSGGTSIVQLANVSRVYVDAQVDEADISLIKTGQTVSITLDAYPDTPKTGTVRKIYPEAETESNVTYVHVQVEVNPSDVDERLRPNMNATCDFLVDDKHGVLTVPSEAVKDEEETTTVTVIKNPQQPLSALENQEKREVKVGVRGDENAEIISGLKAGETVVTQTIEPVVTGSSSGTGRASAPGMMGGPPPR